MDKQTLKQVGLLTAALIVGVTIGVVGGLHLHEMKHKALGTAPVAPIVPPAAPVAPKA